MKRYTDNEDVVFYNNRLSHADSPKKIVRKSVNWLKYFCLSNFHLHTRLPLIKWIKNYHKKDLVNDFIAGAIIAFIMVIQAIAIALIIDVAPQYGLYSSIFGGFVNFIFGTSKDLSVGPTVIAAVVIARYNYLASPQLVSLISFFNGIILVFMSFINLGFLMEFISYPVLTGWITAGAITIFISQLPSWFGLVIPNVSTMCAYSVFGAIVQSISKSKMGDFIIGAISFFLTSSLYFVGKLIRNRLSYERKKSTRVALIFFQYVITARIGWIIVVSSFFAAMYRNNSQHPVSITFFDAPPSGLPIPWNPFKEIISNGTTHSLKEMINAVYPSFVLVPFVVLIESLAGARNFGKQFGYQVDNNQEIMCLGIVNILNSFFRGFTVGGALARTSVNALSGCKSLLGGLITSIILIPTILYLTPLIKYISKASLGACICSAALTQVQITSLVNLWKISKLQLLPWLMTLFAGLYGLEIGILVGFVVSAGFIMFRELRPRINSEYDTVSETGVLYIKGAIHFPGAYSIATRVRTIKNFHPNIKTLIIDCSNMYETDTSVVEELKEAVDTLSKENVEILLKHLKKGRVQDLMFGAGLCRYAIRGMRTNSCIGDFHHGRFNQHFAAFQCNPRDLYTVQDEDAITETQSVALDIENDTNYLYTVRSTG